MTRKDAKTHLLDHSQAKVKLLSAYLKRYLNIIANDHYTERIKIYDLFCGEGIYENEREGSPLVILRVIHDLHFQNVAKLTQIIPIDCQFNDIEKDKVGKVQQIISNKSLHNAKFGNIKYTSNDYQDEVKTLISVLPKLKNQKAFIFIDPYGYKHIRASDIKPLLLNGNAEVLLFLPTQFMYRFDENGTPEALIDFIEELVDYKSWKSSGPNNVWEYIDQLKEAFKQYLEEKFIDTFTIEKDPQTVFCLFFFSSHIKGFEKMLEAKWEIDTEQGKGWSYDSTGDLFSATKTNLLEEKLKVYLKKDIRSNCDIYEFTLRCGFLPKHTNEIFHSLQDSGSLVVESPKDEKVRKGAFYVDYKYYKNENEYNKVKFKLV